MMQVQETLEKIRFRRSWDKYPQLPSDIRWHMIGHLQRNKVKYIVDKVALIHSVDSLRLAETIENEAAKHNVTVPILIEVNVAQEESKFGLKTEEVLSLVESVAALPHINIKGLMTIAPYVRRSGGESWDFPPIEEIKC